MVKMIDENDLVLIIYKDKRYLKRVEPGKSFHGTGGVINFSDLVGTAYGVRYGQYQLFEPTLEDIIMYGLRRETQIVFPKDGYYICFKLNLHCGSRLLEVGAGSGALTCMFSRMVGPEGKVVSFEKEERHYRNAKKNIQRFAEWDNVELHNGDVADYDEDEFDAVFIDVREPWLLLEKVRDLIKGSGSLGTIVPTANQIADTLRGLQDGFGDIEVMELMLRKYKTVAERVRPEDRMVAHTGYLVFARALE
ncbi:MAG: tRNA (adenine(58)-N(1))-methyltransferase TrmI [Syntrophorhabdus sp. PtaU1.Bin153]|nr:MAG: tRNA (adenine(58)-N(1))-methyltransferase TrmI [Syntrophorhabdus sp. PtaU1.Bin153]